MKRIVCTSLALLLTLSALLFLPACSLKSNLPADFVKGDEAVVDNETPFVYDESSVRYYDYEYEGKEYSDTVAWRCYLLEESEHEYTYSSIASLFGNKIVRHYTEGGKDTYYTVYSLPDNKLFYMSLCMKDGVLYLDQDPYCVLNETFDARRGDGLEGYVYEQDYPDAILGDQLPSDCYLENYTPEEIAEKIEFQWASYYNTCNQINIPHSLNHDRDGVECSKFIRCIQSVSFDLVREDGNTYHGCYVYDLYTYRDGTGVLYFYHLYYENFLLQSAYHIIQEETIPLTAEEVSSVVDVMIEQDFANHPTWNPEGFVGMDGSSTDVFAAGNFGNDWTWHLISMWEPTSHYPHYHIRTTIENLVRAHITVEEGRIYRADLYEEYPWMQD